MNGTRITVAARAAAVATVFLLSSPAPAVLTLPGGDTTLDGAFSELHYGPTGAGTAFVAPLLFVSQFAQTVPPPEQVLGTELTFGYSFSGLGTSTFSVDYTITNTSAADTFTNLRFIVNVEPSGSSTSFLDTVQQSWGIAAPGDPDAREIAIFDPLDPLFNRIQANNGVIDGADACGVGSCDADFGLQWNRTSLAPGETWTVHLALSDDPSIPGTQRYLRAVSVDSPDTLLSVSAVPEPRTLLLFIAGLVVVCCVAGRRHSGREAPGT